MLIIKFHSFTVSDEEIIGKFYLEPIFEIPMPQKYIKLSCCEKSRLITPYLRVPYMEN